MRLLLIGLFSFLPAWADLFPTYSYFYSCDSGVVDCSNFSKHWYGDFGLTGAKPPALGQEVMYGMTPSESNVHGEVIGHSWMLYGPGDYLNYAAVYGRDGEVRCLFYRCGTEQVATGYHLVDINNNGLILAYEGGQPYLLNFDSDWRYTERWLSGFGMTLVGVSGINDSDQILATVVTASGATLGVLSPTPVPEPSSIALFAAAVAALGVRHRRRQQKSN